MSSVLNETYFHDEQAAFESLEAILWPGGPTCPHCGATDRINRLEGVLGKPNKKTGAPGKPRLGLWKCYHCRGQFRVTKGTVFESGHLKLHQWFQACYLLCSSKKGCSSNQLARTLGITVKSAWFASHRIREAMREGELAVPFGTGGGGVESDETFLTRKRRRKGEPPRWKASKMKVLTLIDHDTGKARSAVIKNMMPETLQPILRANIAKEARIMTDEATYYGPATFGFASHETVNHSKEQYVRGDVTTNRCEGYFSLFKRGMRGIYQHCQRKHLHKYLAEFDFRYNHRIALGVNDSARTVTALRGIKGKRLYYREPIGSRA